MINEQTSRVKTEQAKAKADKKAEQTLKEEVILVVAENFNWWIHVRVP